MKAAVAAAVPAVGVRDRLAAFVGEVTRPFVLRVQRENALLYVRGLVEQGGRKSLQPTRLAAAGTTLLTPEKTRTAGNRARERALASTRLLIESVFSNPKEQTRLE